MKISPFLLLIITNFMAELLIIKRLKQMQKFQLQSNEPYRKNSKVVVIHAGVIEFNAEGIANIEVETEAQFEAVLNSLPDAFDPSANPKKDDSIKPQTEENELGKSEDEKNDIGGGDKDENDFTGNAANEVTGSQESGSTETTTPATEVVTAPAVTETVTNTTPDAGNEGTQDIAATLQDLKLAELKQLASDSGFPEAEWSELKKKELQAYLLSKLQPQS
jgi:hypothetical protein